MIRTSGRRVALVALAFAALSSSLGCIGPAPSSWGEGISDADRGAVLEGYPADAQRSLVPLSDIFYRRITSRRFNSRATFEDPSVRQFFPTIAAYSDYYAALADDLDRAYIRYNRPTRVDLLGIDRSQTGSLLLSLRFIGKNDLPLRWWSAVLTRTDEWVWQDGRWFVVPGKI